MTPIFPTSYFPPISYMAALVQHKQVLIEAHESYPKQTLRNRTVIVTANGAMSLTVPVHKPEGNHTPTGAIEIAHNERWELRHWRTIEAAYSSAPYFLYYADEINQLLTGTRHDRLTEMNLALTRHILTAIGAHTSLDTTTEYCNELADDADFRQSFQIKRACEERSMEIYQQVFADRMAFVPNVSILDLLFNLGPETLSYLNRAATDVR